MLLSDTNITKSPLLNYSSYFDTSVAAYAFNSDLKHKYIGQACIEIVTIHGGKRTEGHLLKDLITGRKFNTSGECVKSLKWHHTR